MEVPKIKLPPWVSPAGQGVGEGVEVVGVGVGNHPFRVVDRCRE